tara:strand:- start:1017 stop:1250 length:234 start_codon:yes stop_codon:yes gene_type:complete
MDSMPNPLFKAMAAGLLKAAALTEGSEAPADLAKPLLELLQLSIFSISQILGLLLKVEHEVKKISEINRPMSFTYLL